MESFEEEDVSIGVKPTLDFLLTKTTQFGAKSVEPDLWEEPA